MDIIIGTKNQLYKTIGYVSNPSLTNSHCLINTNPCVWYKIGQRKQAIEDLTNYYNESDKLFSLKLPFTEDEYIKWNNYFADKAREKALETIERAESNDLYKDRFFTFLSK